MSGSQHDHQTSPEDRGSRLGRLLERPVVVPGLIALLLVAGVAVALVRSQNNAAATIEAEFTRRAALAARLTSAALGTNSAQYSEVFSGAADKAQAELTAFESSQPDHLAGVADERMRALAVWPPEKRAAARRLATGALARRASAAEGTFLSDLEFVGPERAPAVTIASRFQTPAGRRVFTATIDAAVLETFASAYLASAPAVRGAHAYVLDGNQRVIASTSDLEQGVPLPDRRLAAALRTDTAGDLGASRFTSSPMEGSPWKFVFVASRATLLAPVRGSTRRASWGLFVAFTLALMALIRVGVLASRRAGQLVEARERERAAEGLAHERLHDRLTGLPNRALFLDRTTRALSLAAAAPRPIGVLRMGLDRFTRINDSLGHAAGDQLLVLVAGRLRGNLRQELTLSRFGGDGFLVLCEDVDTTIQIANVAAAVQAALAEPFTISGRVVHLTCGVGIAVKVPGAASMTAETLVRDADAAMYRAKARGTNQVHVSDADVHAQALELLDTEAALRRAIAAGELVVHYQPIVTLPEGRMRGVEALVRWHRPGVGMVPPLEFIGLAEESGLIVDIGRVVLETATQQVAAWAADGLLPEDFSLSVNISAHQLDDEGLVNVVADVLSKWPLEPSALWLEITETAVAHDPEAAHRTLTALRTLGARVALDDFGTGQSSLEHLVRTLPVDILKLDRSFVRHMGDARDRAVVAAVPSMALGLGMLVIAEGAETAEQARTLAEFGYTHVQGFYFGRPVAAQDLWARLADANAGAARA